MNHALNNAKLHAEALQVLVIRNGGELFIPHGPDIKVGTLRARIEDDGVRFLFVPRDTNKHESPPTQEPVAQRVQSAPVSSVLANGTPALGGDPSNAELDALVERLHTFLAIFDSTVRAEDITLDMIISLRDGIEAIVALQGNRSHPTAWIVTHTDSNGAATTSHLTAREGWQIEPVLTLPDEA